MHDNLKDLNITIIGAGPGGLTAALAAKKLGAHVQVLEKAGDPRKDKAGYTNRSFNLTLNEVGRKSLGDARAWSGGIEVRGRVVHVPESNNVILSNEWKGGSEILISIPRHKLRENMVRLAEQKGVELSFDASVDKIDFREVIIYSGNKKVGDDSDLVIVADGINSLVDTTSVVLNKRTDPMRYIQAILSKDACAGMDVHRIHFWHNKPTGSVAIGLPNGNHTIAVLLISPYSDIEEGGVPFFDIQQTAQRLRSEFPALLVLEPALPSQIVGKKIGRFHYKSIDSYVFGEKIVVVGDAGSASPPWAGFGANTAIYSADALIRYIAGFPGDIKGALYAFEEHKALLAKRVLQYANEHGDFLNHKVSKNPDDRPIGPVLGQIINMARKESSQSAGVNLLEF